MRKKKPITITMDKKLDEKIRKLAEKENRTFSAQLAAICSEWFQIKSKEASTVTS